MSRFLVIVFAIVTVCVVAANGGTLKAHQSRIDGRIVGGRDADITEFPHQVSVRLAGSHICGGSILTNKAVLTAGHCVDLFLLAAAHSVEYGVTRLSEAGTVVIARRVSRHPLYNAVTIDYDVAVIILLTPIIFSAKAQPIIIMDSTAAAGAAAIVTGWGTTSEGGTSSDILQAVAIHITDRDICKAQYGASSITDNMICAGEPEGGKDSCQGDSGGPLQVAGQLAGSVSWGNGCARPNYSGVYCDVTKFKAWIFQCIGNVLHCLIP